MTRSNLRIYVICPKKRKYYFDKIFEGTYKAEVELLSPGIKIEYFYPKNDNVACQIELLSQMQNLNPDGIVLLPASSTKLNYLIDEIVDIDIPVVTFYNDAPYSKRLCYVGADNYTSGKLCGELMSNYLSSTGNVVIFSGDNESYTLKQRILGFKEKIKTTYPNIKILKTINYSNDENTCYSLAIKELSESEKEIDGIFVTSITGSLGVGKALEELNLSFSPKVIGFNLNEQLAKYVANGFINSLIYQDPFPQGYLSLKIMHDYLSCGLVPESENIYTKTDIILQENLENFIQ